MPRRMDRLGVIMIEQESGDLALTVIGETTDNLNICDKTHIS